MVGSVARCRTASIALSGQRLDVEIDYVADGDELIVIAIFHCKRRPGYWRDRLTKIRPK